MIPNLTPYKEKKKKRENGRAKNKLECFCLLKKKKRGTRIKGKPPHNSLYK